MSTHAPGVAAENVAKGGRFHDTGAVGALVWCLLFFFQAEDGIRDDLVTGVQTCALPISDELARIKAYIRGSMLLGMEGTHQVASWLGGQESLRSDVLDIDKMVALIEAVRSEERRVGKECRSRWSPYH